MEVSYTYIYLINWVSIRKWACQLSQNKSKENWFIKEYFHENTSELQEKSIVQFECQIFDVCHLSSNKSKENWFIKGCVLWKKIMFGLLFMNDFNEDLSELQEKSIVQFECQIFYVCHLSSNKSKENWFIKGFVFLKKEHEWF